MLLVVLPKPTQLDGKKKCAVLIASFLTACTILFLGLPYHSVHIVEKCSTVTVRYLKFP